VGHLYFAGVRIRCVSAKEFGSFPQRLPAFRNLVRRELPGVGNHRPDFQLDGDARSASAFGETRRIIPKKFVLAHVNEKRRKA
jgi:hypothetical protein